MDSVYCIYTDTEINITETTLEHIIPLSLGGSDDFVIPVHAPTNSRLGSEIDGKLTNDGIYPLMRKHFGYKGQSKKEPVAKWTKSKIDGTDIPVSVHFSKESVDVFNHKERRKLTEEEMSEVTFQSIVQMDRFIESRFAAKVLLAGGYFVYRDDFRNYADHKALRDYMNASNNDERRKFAGSSLRFAGKFTEMSNETKAYVYIFKEMHKMLKESSVIFMRVHEALIGSVGLGGSFVFSISFGVDEKKFPAHDEFEMGYYIAINKGEVTRGSFYELREDLKKHLNIPL